jgi:hypothetical protein
LVGVVLTLAVVFGAQAAAVVLDGEPTVGVADLVVDVTQPVGDITARGVLAVQVPYFDGAA